MKCPNCNTEFEGNICPNCSTEFEGNINQICNSKCTTTETEAAGAQIADEPEPANVEAALNESADILASSVENVPESLAPTFNEPVDEEPPVRNKKISPRLVLEIIGGALLLFFVITTFSRVPKSELLKAESDSAKKADELSAKAESIQDKLDSITKEYEDYKTKMKPFEALDAAEAEARKIEAEKVAADKKAQEEAAAAEAAAAKAAEEAAGYETGITYDQLARTPDDFNGKKVKFSGKVIQVLESGSTVQIRLAVDDNYDTILLGEYQSSILSTRVLEDDYITIYGTSTGVISYKSTMGGTITIPGVSIVQIDQ